MSDLSRTEPEIKDKLSPGDIVRLQINRTNLSATDEDEDKYLRNAEVLMDNLPPHKLVEILQKEDEYTDKIEEYHYRKHAGRNIGTPEAPINGSPEKVIVKQVNPRKLFRIVNEAFQDAGALWRIEHNNTVYGRFPILAGDETPLFDKKKGDLLVYEGSFNQICYILQNNQIKKIINWNGWACGISPGEKPWFLNELQGRITIQEPIVILITGTQGKGKSYMGLALAQILDKRFDPKKQVVFERKEIAQLVGGNSTLNRGQVVIIDEGQFGIGARKWTQTDQQETMDILISGRVYGYIIIMIALHRSLLDTQARNQLINYWINMKHRSHGIVYNYEIQQHGSFDKYHPPRLGKITLPLPDWDQCKHWSCLKCEYLNSEANLCLTLRAEYERKKMNFIKARSKALIDKMTLHEKRENAPSDLEAVKRIYELKDRIHYTQKGYPDPASIQSLYESEYGIHIGGRKATNLRKRLMIEYPELMPQT